MSRRLVEVPLDGTFTLPCGCRPCDRHLDVHLSRLEDQHYREQRGEEIRAEVDDPAGEDAASRGDV